MSGEYFSDHQYYTCAWRNNHHSHLEERTCWARSVCADAIEADVWDCILGLFCDLEKLEMQLRIAQQEELAALDPKLEELNAINAMIVQTEADAVEIGQAMKRATGLVAKSLEQNMNEVNQRYDALCRRKETLQADLSVTELTDDAIQGLVEFAQDVFVGIEDSDFQVKRRNLEMLKVQVVVDNGMFTIYSLAGKIVGEIRKLPKAPKGGSGGGGVTNLRLPAPSLQISRFPPGIFQPAE